MSIEHIRRASREGIMSLYQVDPGFYRMIISRNPSLGRSPTARSVYHSATNGKVPFVWETEPGEPKLGTAGSKTAPPISLPPGGARGFTIPNPTSRPRKKGKKIHIRIPRLRAVEAKAYIKKVKQVGRIASTNKKKSPSFHDRSDDDDDENDNEDDDGLTRSSSHGISMSRWSFLLSSSSSYSNAHKSGDKSERLLLKVLRVLRLPGEIFKWKTKSSTNLTS